MAAKGTRVYAGGKGLYIFEKDAVEDDKYKVLSYDGNDKKSFFGLKVAKSGHLITQEAVSNDLVILDNTGEEKMRNRGSKKAVFGRRL